MIITKNGATKKLNVEQFKVALLNMSGSEFCLRYEEICNLKSAMETLLNKGKKLVESGKMTNSMLEKYNESKNNYHDVLRAWDVFVEVGLQNGYLYEHDNSLRRFVRKCHKCKNVIPSISEGNTDRELNRGGLPFDQLPKLGYTSPYWICCGVVYYDHSAYLLSVIDENRDYRQLVIENSEMWNDVVSLVRNLLVNVVNKENSVFDRLSDYESRFCIKAMLQRFKKSELIDCAQKFRFTNQQGLFFTHKTKKETIIDVIIENVVPM